MSKLNSSKNDDGIIYEDAETYEDTYSEPDKDETMPQLFEEETSDKPVHKRTRMSKPKVPVQKQQQQFQPFGKLEVLDHREKCVRCQHPNFGLYHVGPAEIEQRCLFCGCRTHIWWRRGYLVK